MDKAKSKFAEKLWEDGRITWTNQEIFAEDLEFVVWRVYDQLNKGLLVRRIHSICPFQDKILRRLKDKLYQNCLTPDKRMKNLFRCNVHWSYDDKSVSQ